MNALLPLYFLPDIPYMALLLNSEQVLLEQHENFVKSGPRNRTQIIGANGPLLLTVPIQGGRDTRQPYRQTKISYQADWQRQHLQTLKSAYGSSPFFQHYYTALIPVYEMKEDFLFEFNYRLLLWIFSMLKVKPSLHFTAVYSTEAPGFNNYRNGKFPPVQPEAYEQPFGNKFPFTSQCSVLDLLFNTGPGAAGYLRHIAANS